MAGISRSASVVVAYLVKHEKMPLPEALWRAKDIRSVVNPNSVR
jgi:atypical dual specificity phosphatase